MADGVCAHVPVFGGEAYYAEAKHDEAYDGVARTVFDDEVAALERWVSAEARPALPAVAARRPVAVSLFPPVAPVLPSLSFLCIGCSLSSVVAVVAAQRWLLVRNRLGPVGVFFPVRILCGDSFGYNLIKHCQTCVLSAYLKLSSPKCGFEVFSELRKFYYWSFLSMFLVKGRCKFNNFVCGKNIIN